MSDPFDAHDSPETPEDSGAASEDALAPVDSSKDRDPFPWGFLFGAILMAAVVVFVVQNNDPVPVEFLGWAGEFPLSIVVAVAVLVSIILTQSVGAVFRRRRRKRKAEKEELRALRGDG